MLEKDLISKIEKLRSIKPNRDWVALTKVRIFGQEDKPSLFKRLSSVLSVFPRLGLQYKLSFAIILLIGFLSGAVSFAKKSLPGDLFYSVKRMEERVRQVLLPADAKSQFQIQLANERLQELDKVAKLNQAERLAPALSEFEKTKVLAEQEFEKSINSKEKKEAVKMAKELIPSLIKMKKMEKQVFGSLGIEAKKDENISEKATAKILIDDLRSQILNVKDFNILKEGETNYEKGDYEAALQVIIEAYAK